MMDMIKPYTVYLFLFLFSCIGEDVIDDYVEPQLKITNPIDTLSIGDSYEFEIRYLNNIGEMVIPNLEWMSDDTDIMIVDQQGLITAVDSGRAVITAKLEGDQGLMASIAVVSYPVPTIDPDPVDDPEDSATRMGSIASVSSYVLQGDFVISEIDGGIQIDFAENYVASTALPGLYIYLTNNPSTNMGAYEIGPVTTFSGVHSYQILGADVTLTTYDYVLYYCKPFVVKVGDGLIN